MGGVGLSVCIDTHRRAQEEQEHRKGKGHVRPEARITVGKGHNGAMNNRTHKGRRLDGKGMSTLEEINPTEGREPHRGPNVRRQTMKGTGKS